MPVSIDDLSEEMRRVVVTKMILKSVASKIIQSINTEDSPPPPKWIIPPPPPPPTIEPPPISDIEIEATEYQIRSKGSPSEEILKIWGYQ